MIIIIGNYEAAADFAAEHKLAMHQWAPAYGRESARRALMGRDPDSTIIEYVHGFERVMTPEVREMIAVLTALRSTE
jgi:hypothetical protein